MIKSIARISSALGRWSIASALRNGQNVGNALVQIWANKGRSFLTTLGVIIAVTAIITVVSFVEGFGRYMSDMLKGYGQYVIVYPYDPPARRAEGMRRATLDLTDVEAVRGECDKVRRISPFVYTETEVTYGNELAKEIPMRGVSEEYQVIRNFNVDAGRFFGPVDVDNAAQVCVLGRTLLELLGCDDSLIGGTIHIAGRRFRVIGLLQSKGSFMGDDQDETVMMPYTVALKMYPERRTRMPFLVEATGTSENDIDEAQAQVTRLLRKRHRLEIDQPDDFRISRQDQFLKEFKKVRTITSSILAGIVSISLLVGGIGIMNIMLVSVTERTREIGLRKSLGGRRRDIMVQFLTEAVVLCTAGGLIGVSLGLAITTLGSLHPQMPDLKVPAWSIALALGFSAGTGILFGVIPAFKAAILNPIEALRHE